MMRRGRLGGFVGGRRRDRRGGGARASGAALAAALLLATPSLAQQVDPARGVDPELDYAALTRYGPWDDRNYELTAADLELLAPNEEELVEPLPAFFRVLLRRAQPSLPRHGPAQYPRSALSTFRNLCGGILVDGRFHTRVERREGRWHLVGEGEPGAADDYPNCRLEPRPDPRLDRR